MINPSLSLLWLDKHSGAFMDTAYVTRQHEQGLNFSQQMQ